MIVGPGRIRAVSFREPLVGQGDGGVRLLGVIGGAVRGLVLRGHRQAEHRTERNEQGDQQGQQRAPFPAHHGGPRILENEHAAFLQFSHGAAKAMAVAAGQQWPGDRPRRGVRGGSPVATTMVRLRVCYLVHFCYTAWGSLRARWKPRRREASEWCRLGGPSSVCGDTMAGCMKNDG